MTTLTLRIDWSEMDLFGHVNNVMYLKYMQAARVHYWENIGMYQSFLKDGIGPMVASVQCQFKKPLHFPGNVEITTAMIWMKNTSFSLSHLLKNDAGDVVAEGADVVVLFDFNKNEKMPIPQTIRELVGKLEGKEF